MAKKKQMARRVPRSATPRMYGDGKPAQATQPTPSARANDVTTPRTFGGAGRSTMALSQEYHYVPTDLRRLGILAVGIFAVLIVLGLVVR
jgi:hypothetical protein